MRTEAEEGDCAKIAYRCLEWDHVQGESQGFRVNRTSLAIELLIGKVVSNGAQKLVPSESAAGHQVNAYAAE